MSTEVYSYSRFVMFLMATIVGCQALSAFEVGESGDGSVFVHQPGDLLSIRADARALTIGFDEHEPLTNLRRFSGLTYLGFDTGGVIDSRHLASIANMQHLHTLEIWESSTLSDDDDTNAAIGGMTHLKALACMGGWGGTKATLVSITKLTNLEILRIGHYEEPRLPAEMAEMKLLRELQLFRTYTTLSGASKFKLDTWNVTLLASLPALRELTIGGACDVPGSFKDDVKLLTRISKLWVEGLDADEMVSIATLNALTSLTVNEFEFTAESYAALFSMENLIALRLINSYRDYKPEQLGSFPKLKLLRELEIVGAGIDDSVTRGIAQLGKLKVLHLPWDSSVSDAGASSIASLSELTHLSMGGRGVSLNGIAKLAALTSLKELTIYALEMDNSVLKSLAPLVWLESLTLQTYEIGRNHLSDEGLAHLSTLVRLKVLSLSAPNIAGIGFRSLGNMNGIEVMDLENCGISDEGIEAIAKVAKVRQLRLRDSVITDRSMGILAEMSQLRVLSLYGCNNITDGGIAKLGKCTWLQNVYVAYCEKITAEGVLALRKSLPNTSVSG